jgi:membrane protease YdiL (CAAX protease family)
MVKRFAELTVLVISFFIPNLVIEQFRGESNILEVDFLLYSFVILAMLQFFFMYKTIKIAGNFSFEELGITRPRLSSIFAIIATSAGIISLYLLYSVLLSFLPPATTEYLMKGYQWNINSLARIPGIILFCLVTGYREELLFRSYFLSMLRKVGSPIQLSVLINTVLFGMLHSYEGIAAMIFAGIAALYFSLVFVRVKNLHVIAIAHGIFNSSILILSYFV